MPIQQLGLSTLETRNSLESPSTPLNSALGWEILSGGNVSDAGELVSPGTAMGQATVCSCVRLISESVAAMPLRLYRTQGSGKVEATDSPLHALLSTEPNEESSAFTLWSAFVASILLHGNGYIEPQFDGLGVVQNLWFLPPTAVTPTRQSDGSLVYKISQGMKAGSYRLLKPGQIIHVPGSFSLDGVTGLSVVSQARATIGGAIALDRHGNRFFSNFSTPNLAILTKKLIKPEVKSEMRRSWEALQGGANSHRVAILDQEMELRPISTPNSDAQWIESRKMGREEIAGLFGLRPSQLGSEARVSGETFSQQSLEFLTTTLSPWLHRIKQEVTRKLLRGRPDLSVEFDVSDRIKLDTESQLKAFATGRQWGVLTANECRRSLGLDPVGPEGDALWRPVNMVDATQPNPTTTEGTENV